MKKRFIQGLKLTVVYTVLTIVFLEVLLWIVGYRPYSNDDYKVSSSPDYPYVADKKLGIRLNEGTFDITLNDAVHFKAIHQENGERKIPGSDTNNGPEVLFLGCSYAYGYGVNDDESFPALIQKNHPDWNVRNAAVVGYGTTQHLIQLRERLKNHPPESVIVALSSAHLIRTVLSQRYRSNLKIGFKRSSTKVDRRMKGSKFPYMNSCGKISYQDWETMYTEIPGRYWFATANYFQIQYDNAKEPKCDPIEITSCIIMEMAELCRQKNISFGVVCLDTNHKTREIQNRLHSLPWINIGFSFKSKKYTHLPHDSHPNQKGHKKIANQVEPFIETLLNNAKI